MFLFLHVKGKGEMLSLQFKRLIHSIKKSPVGFAFDIDGVLMQSKNPILPYARDTVTLLQDHKIPFVLLTNGGGQTEASRVSFLNKSLSLKNPLRTSQIVLSHTPMRNLTGKYNRVLVVGGDDPQTREVAQSYGFQEVIRPIDIVREAPNIWPFIRYTREEIQALSKPVDLRQPIDAVFVFNDPRDMGTDTQIVIDALCSENGVLGTRRGIGSSKPSVPIIFSNMDLLWSTGYPIPRFGQGAFRLTIRELYKQLNNAELEDIVLGKPWPVSYTYAENVLNDEWKLLNGDRSGANEIPELGVKPKEQLVENVYMVGDNPQSDISGGNNYGWETILVETGVYKEGDFHKYPTLAKPTFGIFPNVWDGVTSALKRHQVI